MEFTELYNRLIELWPEEIEISDGYPVGESGFMFPTLSKVHNEIDDKIDHKNDHWGNIGVWSFFQAFHLSAQELLENGGAVLNTRDVLKEIIDRYLKSNLQSEEWKPERLQYKGL